MTLAVCFVVVGLGLRTVWKNTMPFLTVAVLVLSTLATAVLFHLAFQGIGH